MSATFGFEEEFVLLDPRTLETRDLADRAIRDLAAVAGGGALVREFFPSQIEYVSPVFTSGADAAHELLTFRTALAAWAQRTGVVVAGSGTPWNASPAAVNPEDRYRRIAAQIGAVAPEHQINGLHVHVGVGDRAEGVRISNALRAWLPTLLALSANSPFWHAEDTGFASWRALHSRRWTTSGIPPVFSDPDEYDAIVNGLLGVGVTTDAGTINWNVRLSQHVPTVEVRVFDAQLDPVSTLGLTMLVRALAATPEPSPIEPTPGLWDAALWHGARFGLSSTLVDPADGTVRPAADVVARLRRAADPGFMQAAEALLVDEFLRRAGRSGSGADRQRGAAARGIRALSELYRSALDAPLPTVAQPLPA